ncbi:MAG: UDP-N-acetylglucosamine 2-epimerase [Holophaga sp.]|jgi:UDP-hydrolysing UDP-N-acetyl-D-glucosamine 2-epimerase
MASPRKICVVTGSRAEYGLLRWVMEGIRTDPDLSLQVIATGSHLAPAFGSTYREIEGDGFRIDRSVEILPDADTAAGVVAAMGRGLAGFAQALEDLGPDLVVVLGDRYEIMAAAQAAMVMRIPLAHLCGGDETPGTYDNVIRHCITKMAALHFVTHREAMDRVIQMGEARDRVFCFGATCVDSLLRLDLMSRGELEADLGIALGREAFVITFHPLTLRPEGQESHLRALFAALDRLRSEGDRVLVFTGSNADNGGGRFNTLIGEFAASRADCHRFASLGHRRYLSLVRCAAAVIGNSSSGIYEAPYLGVPTVDIGERQRGRMAPASVVRCEPTEAAIHEAILRALALPRGGVPMIYGDGGASERIVAKIKELAGQPELCIKHFTTLSTAPCAGPGPIEIGS